MYVFRPAKSKKFTKCCWYEGAVSPKTCKDIIGLFDEKNPVVSGVHKDNKQSELLRKSEVTWIHYSEKTEWVFKLLEKYIYEVNGTKYNFQLSGLYEALQLTKYPPGGHYTWHEDNMEPEFTTRKLSIVIQLSDPADFSGGEFIIFPSTKPPRTQGSVYIFPSFVTHKVSPVEQGVRYSLVAWVTGEPFK